MKLYITDIVDIKHLLWLLWNFCIQIVKGDWDEALEALQWFKFHITTPHRLLKDK